jgi:FAD synthase
MLDLGIDDVLCVRFRKQDFSATAAQFLDTLCENVELDELWLGELQLLGPGSEGGRAAITKFAQTHGISLTVLPRPPLSIYEFVSFWHRAK